MKSGKTCFTKIRKWATAVGAVVTDSDYFDAITIEYKGKVFKAEQRESTSRKTIARGRGLKWSGTPAGFYFGEITEPRHGYLFESTQAKAIEEMERLVRLK